MQEAVSVHREPGGVLRLIGDIDLGSVPIVRTALLDAVRLGPVVLDLREVTHLASAGVGLLLEAAAAGPLRLRVSPGGPVARVLALSGVDGVLPRM